MSRHVLLTGFEPFGPHRVNPSELLVRSMEGRLIGGRVVGVLILPVETRTLHERLERALAEAQPELVIGTGYAPGISALALERIGVNVLDFAIADSAGTMRKGEPVQPGGPDAYLSTLPLAEIADAWASAGVPGYVSESAGTYLCNQWLYEALALTGAASPPAPAGFVHVPALPGQAVQLGAARTPSMTLELMCRGLEVAIEAASLWLERRAASPPEPKRASASGQVWIPPRTMKR